MNSSRFEEKLLQGPRLKSGDPEDWSEVSEAAKTTESRCNPCRSHIRGTSIMGSILRKARISLRDSQNYSCLLNLCRSEPISFEGMSLTSFHFRSISHSCMNLTQKCRISYICFYSASDSSIGREQRQSRPKLRRRVVTWFVVR